MQINDLQRIKITIKTLISLGAARNQEEIGKLIGYTNKSSFSQVVNGIVNLPSDFIDRLCALNTAINIDWVRTGEGNILYNKEVPQGYTNIKLLRDENEGDYFDHQALSLISGENMMEYNINKESVKLEKMRFFVPTFKEADYLITVKGSSMYPEFNNGDVVACKHLPLDTFFQWNKVYVVNTEQGLLLKRVCKSDDDDYITMVSENKGYSSFELPRSKVLAIAIVTGVIRVV